MSETPTATAPPMNENLLSGLALLLQSRLYAEESKADLWDFALEIDVLDNAGVTVTDLRWLVTKAYVEHGQETSAYGDAHRSFRPSTGLNFDNTTCFVLTPPGAAFAEMALKQGQGN